MQVRWWSAFEKQYAGEIAAEESIFGGEAGQKRQQDLRLRVIEHNVLVIAKYYARISVARLSTLLDLTPEEVHYCHLDAMMRLCIIIIFTKLISPGTKCASEKPCNACSVCRATA